MEQVSQSWSRTNVCRGMFRGYCTSTLTAKSPGSRVGRPKEVEPLVTCEAGCDQRTESSVARNHPAINKCQRKQPSHQQRRRNRPEPAEEFGGIARQSLVPRSCPAPRGRNPGKRPQTSGCLLSQSVFSRMRSEGFSFNSWGSGGRALFAIRCFYVRNRPQPFATVRNRSR